jgi:hypothetical protein
VGIWWEFGGNLVELSVPDYQGITSFFGNLVGIWWEFGGNLKQEKKGQRGFGGDLKQEKKGQRGFGGNLVGIWWVCAFVNKPLSFIWGILVGGFAVNLW